MPSLFSCVLFKMFWIICLPVSVFLLCNSFFSVAQMCGMPAGIWSESRGVCRELIAMEMPIGVLQPDRWEARVDPCYASAARSNCCCS